MRYAFDKFALSLVPLARASCAIVALALGCSAQVSLRLAEDPVRGADMVFQVTGSQASSQFIFVLSAGEGPTPLNLIDPRDPRRLDVDLMQVAFAREGHLDLRRRAEFTVPVHIAASFETRPFYAQLVTFPGITTLVDEISNVVTGRVRVGSGSLCGIVQTENGKPLSGVRIELLNTPYATFTNTAGEFALPRVPSGRHRLAVDGTVLAVPGYPRVVMLLDIEDGTKTTLPFIVYLPRAFGGVAITPPMLGPGGALLQSISVTNPTIPGVQLLVPAGTRIVFPDGSSQGHTVQIIRVRADRTPMPMPEESRPEWDFAMYPPDTHLDFTYVPGTTGAALTMVTDEPLVVGTRWALMAPDHDSLPMRFDRVGTMEVMSNGPTVLQTIEGGVRGGSWHWFEAAMASVGMTDEDEFCDLVDRCEDMPQWLKKACADRQGTNCYVGLANGDLRGRVSTPAYHASGESWSLSLGYRSSRAEPYAIRTITGTIEASMMTPPRFSISGGLGRAATVQSVHYSTARTGGPRRYRAVRAVRAELFQTGEHLLRALLRSHYTRSEFSVVIERRTLIENEAQSPFGAGWTLEGYDRLIVLPENRYLVSGGDGSKRTYRRVNAVAGVAGTGSNGCSGDGGPAVQAELYRPDHMVVDSRGHLYFVDAGHHSVRRIDAAGLVTTVAGICAQAGNTGDDGPATSAKLDFTILPGVFEGGVAIDEARRRLYIADQGNHRIRYVDLTRGTIHAYAGTRIAGFGGDGGAPLLARFHHPCALALDALGQLWITDTENHVIRRISADGMRIETVAGTPGVPGYEGDGGPATLARFAFPDGIAVDPFGTVYVADNDNHLVRRITASGRIERFLGNGTPGPMVADAQRLETPLGAPADVAIDGQGNLFVSSGDQGQIAKVRPDGIVEIVADRSHSNPPDTPTGIALAPDGNLYFAEPLRHRIRSFSVETGTWEPEAGPQDSTLQRLRSGDFVLIGPDLSQQSFDSLGRMTRLRMPHGASLEFRLRPGADLVEALVLPNGESFRFQYDGANRLSSITDPANRVCRATVQDGRLVAWDVPGPGENLRAVTRFEYRSNLLAAMIAPGGATTRFEFTPEGVYLGAQLENAQGEDWRWSVEPRVAAGLPGLSGPSGTALDPLDAVEFGATTAAIHGDPFGRRTTYFYDEEGRPVGVRDALGHASHVTLNAQGLPELLSAPGNASNPTRRAETRFTYDLRGRVLSVQGPERGPNELYRFEYASAYPTPTRMIDPLGNATAVDLDGAGRVLRVTDPTGVFEEFEYLQGSLLRRVRTVVQDRIVELSAEWDPRSQRLIAETGFDGVRSAYEYDAAGRRTLTRRGGVPGLRSVFHPDGRLLRIESLSSGTLETYAYDAAGRFVEKRDAKTPAGITRYAYDALGRRTSRTDPNGASDTWTYFDARRRVRWIDRAGAVFESVLDERGGLKEVRSGSALLADCSYDARGNLLRIRDDQSAVDFEWDLEDRPLSESTTLPDGAPHRATTAYDAAGRPISSSHAGYTVTRSYDGADRLTQIADNFGATYDLSYRGGIASEIRRSNGVATYRRIDANGLLERLEHRHVATSSTLSSWEVLQRDAFGNPLAIDENRGGLFRSGRHHYTYDAQGQLTGATHPDPIQPAESYTYDPHWNRVDGPRTAVDAADRLLANETHDFQYDRAGRLVRQVERASGETTRFEWDERGRLAQMSRAPGVFAPPDWVQINSYDVLGRRVRRVTVGSESEDLVFGYAGGGLVLVRDVLRGRSFALARSEDDSRPLWSSELGQAAAERLWYLESEIGTIQSVVDDRAQPVSAWSYSTYGSRQASGAASLSTNATRDLFGWIGGMQDSEDLVQLGARHLDGRHGRFLSEEPLSLEPNAYSYAMNRPTALVDTNGLSATGLSDRECLKRISVYDFIQGELARQRRLLDLVEMGREFYRFGTDFLIFAVSYAVPGGGLVVALLVTFGGDYVISPLAVRVLDETSDEATDRIEKLLKQTGALTETYDKCIKQLCSRLK